MLKKGHTHRLVIVKSYIYLFVCFSTKATHMGAVSDLTTESFSWPASSASLPVADYPRSFTPTMAQIFREPATTLQNCTSF